MCGGEIGAGQNAEGEDVAPRDGEESMCVSSREMEGNMTTHNNGSSVGSTRDTLGIATMGSVIKSKIVGWRGGAGTIEGVYATTKPAEDVNFEMKLRLGECRMTPSKTLKRLCR